MGEGTGRVSMLFKIRKCLQYVPASSAAHLMVTDMFAKLGQFRTCMLIYKSVNYRLGLSQCFVTVFSNLIQVWHEGRCLGGDAYMQPQLLHNLVNLLLHCCGVPGSLFALYGLHTQKLISNLTLDSTSIRDDSMTSAATEHIQRIQHTEY